MHFQRAQHVTLVPSKVLSAVADTMPDKLRVKSGLECVRTLAADIRRIAMV
jgi:hypothetical protein